MWSAFVWLCKNLGLILGILQIVLTALVDIIAQIAKVCAGIANILQPCREKDMLVEWAAGLEKVSAVIDSWFVHIKSKLYGMSTCKVKPKEVKK